MTSLDDTDYYDAHVHVQVKHFIDGNARVEAAVNRVLGVAPESPRRVLEVGCGIGHVAGRLSVRWPGADIIGVDTSPKSIDIAQRLFGSDRLTYRQGLLEDIRLEPAFDVMLLMDVLEHVPVSSRSALVDELTRLAAPEAVIVATVPTPEFLQWLRDNDPDRIQPVDEDITPGLLSDIAAQMGRALLTYQQIAVWRRNDYAHAVIGDGSVGPKPPSPPPVRQSRLSRIRPPSRPTGRYDTAVQRRDHVVARLGAAALPPASARIGDKK